MLGLSNTDHLPRTDEEAEKFFKETYSDPLTASCVSRIYQCRRARGETVLTAFKRALMAYIAAGEDGKDL